jgi:hypothetical protein
MNATRRTDLAAGAVVTIIGLAAAYEAWNMPRFEARNADPLTVPGITPGILSLVLTGLGIALILRSLAARGDALSLPITHWPAGSARRSAFTVAAVLIYGLALFGRFPFVPATALFIFVFTVGTELLNAERRLSLPVLLAGAAGLALLGAFSIYYAFTTLFLVRLPG